MLNYLWAFMILIGICWGAYSGNLNAVTEEILNSAKEAITLCMTMLGVMSLWSGILEIGEKAGLIEQLSKKMSPVLHFLFPKLPPNHPAAKHIATNMIANMVGVGSAATPAGLRGMEELKNLEDERRNQRKSKLAPETASDEMCTFLVINISSLQLIPITMIAYRSQYGSVSPTAIVGPALIATLISTAAGIIFCKIMTRS